MKKYLSKLKSKIKALWESFKYWLIKRLGGYTFPPVELEIKAEPIMTVPVTASMMVNKIQYEGDRGYREYVTEEIARLLAHQILVSGVVLNETVVELNDNEYIVKVSAKLVKGGEG